MSVQQLQQVQSIIQGHRSSVYLGDLLNTQMRRISIHQYKKTKKKTNPESPNRNTQKLF